MTRTTFTALLFAALALAATAQPPERAPAVLPDKPGADAEPLPPVPKADPASNVVPDPGAKGLFIEVLPNKKGMRVLVETEVCLREGPLEVFLCKKNSKEHESILRVDLDARKVHTALLLAGATEGKPVQFVNPRTREAEYKPATGSKVKVLVHYRKGGQLHTHPAQDWVWNFKVKKAMNHDWVFAGSRLIRDPDRPNDPPFYAANSGDVIGISNSPDAMLDLPVEVSRDDAELAFEAKTDKIPSLLSKVWVILEPIVEKK